MSTHISIPDIRFFEAEKKTSTWVNSKNLFDVLDKGDAEKYFHWWRNMVNIFQLEKNKDFMTVDKEVLVAIDYALAIVKAYGPAKDHIHNYLKQYSPRARFLKLKRHKKLWQKRIMCIKQCIQRGWKREELQKILGMDKWFSRKESNEKFWQYVLR